MGGTGKMMKEKGRRKRMERVKSGKRGSNREGKGKDLDKVTGKGERKLKGKGKERERRRR